MLEPLARALGEGEGRVSQPDSSRRRARMVLKAFFLGVIDAELNGICSGQRGSFADRDFAREILLELDRRAHRVIAQTHRNRRFALSDLVGAMTCFGDIRHSCIDPAICDTQRRAVQSRRIVRRGGFDGRQTLRAPRLSAGRPASAVRCGRLGTPESCRSYRARCESLTSTSTTASTIACRRRASIARAPVCLTARDNSTASSSDPALPPLERPK